MVFNVFDVSLQQSSSIGSWYNLSYSPCFSLRFGMGGARGNSLAKKRIFRGFQLSFVQEIIRFYRICAGFCRISKESDMTLLDFDEILELRHQRCRWPFRHFCPPGCSCPRPLLHHSVNCWCRGQQKMYMFSFDRFTLELSAIKYMIQYSVFTHYV